MGDDLIIKMLFARDESALTAVNEKYRRLCTSIAYRILGSAGDAEECWNDTLLKLWNSVPPNEPKNLSAYIAKITRNHALDRFRSARRNERECTYDICRELKDTFKKYESTDLIDSLVIRETINEFTGSLPENKRLVFIARYWDFEPVKNISDMFGYSEGKVKMMLARMRKDLKKLFDERGILL